jgi:hypothetical protein
MNLEKLRRYLQADISEQLQRSCAKLIPKVRHVASHFLQIAGPPM